MSHDGIVSQVRDYFGDDLPAPQIEASPQAAAIERLLTCVKTGEYRQADVALRKEKSLDPAGKLTLIEAVNSSYLFRRDLEWTNHGILRSFRFWSPQEKADYLRMTREIMVSLKRLSPHVSLGFGSVLAIVRDGDFIPHDDDMDVLIAFEVEKLNKFPDALSQIEQVLLADGYGVHGRYPSHRNVNRDGGTAVDVFVGFVEEGDVSWFPSKRRNLRMSQVFPTRSVELFGVECDIPNQPEQYLAATYGADWRMPISNWNHPWKQDEYRDFLPVAPVDRKHLRLVPRLVERLRQLLGFRPARMAGADKGAAGDGAHATRKSRSKSPKKKSRSAKARPRR